MVFSSSHWPFSSFYCVLFRTPKAYLEQISPRNAITIEENAPIGQIYDIVASQISKIESDIGFSDGRILYDGSELQELQKKNARINRNIKNEMVKVTRQWDARVNAFEKRFKHFEGIFKQMARDCHSKWNMKVKLLKGESSALESPITMLVHDKMKDPKGVTSFSNQAAALVLKLAINRAIESPILIIDSIDYVVEKQLIG